MLGIVENMSGYVCPHCSTCTNVFSSGGGKALAEHAKVESIYAGVSNLMSYGENPHYVKLPIFSEFMENSTKFMKNSDLTKWTQNLR